MLAVWDLLLNCQTKKRDQLPIFFAGEKEVEVKNGDGVDHLLIYNNQNWSPHTWLTQTLPWYMHYLMKRVIIMWEKRKNRSPGLSVCLSGPVIGSEYLCPDFRAGDVCCRQGAVAGCKPGDHMGRCSTTNLPPGEEEKGPECCMSIESIDWQYWQGFKKSLFYQWKQRQGIVCLKANLCGGRLVEWWWWSSISDFYLVHQYSGPALVLPRLCESKYLTTSRQPIIWASLTISIIVKMPERSSSTLFLICLLSKARERCERVVIFPL